MSLKNRNVVNPENRKRVAIVLSNPAISSTGWPVGFWWSDIRSFLKTFGQLSFDVRLLPGPRKWGM